MTHLFIADNIRSGCCLKIETEKKNRRPFIQKNKQIHERCNTYKNDKSLHENEIGCFKYRVLFIYVMINFNFFEKKESKTTIHKEVAENDRTIFLLFQHRHTYDPNIVILLRSTSIEYRLSLSD